MSERSSAHWRQTLSSPETVSLSACMALCHKWVLRATIALAFRYPTSACQTGRTEKIERAYRHLLPQPLGGDTVLRDLFYVSRIEASEKCAVSRLRNLLPTRTKPGPHMCQFIRKLGMMNGETYIS